MARAKRARRLYAALLGLLVLTAAQPQAALAAGRIDTDKSVSLAISYARPEGPLSGVEFSLYRVADVATDETFTLSGAFGGYAVSLEGLDSGGWKALADTLAAYALRDGIAAADSGLTDADGALLFPQRQADMKPGLYLVLGAPSRIGKSTYTPQPFLIGLPSRDAADQWAYDAQAEPKYDIAQDRETSVRALKLWKDGGAKSGRPKEITVQLLRDGAVYDEVVLNEAASWRHVWGELDAAHSWQVVEKDVPLGYTVSVSREGTAFYLTNTRGGTPDKPDRPGKLPQTGMLMWPIPLFATAGMLLFSAGWARHRRRGRAGDE